MTQQSEKKPPDIISDEDAPFVEDKIGTEDKKLSFEKKVPELYSYKKLIIGSETIFICLFLMAICILISICNPENDLVNTGFDAFKTIIMTLIGYIFGVNTSDKENR